MKEKNNLIVTVITVCVVFVLVGVIYLATMGLRQNREVMKVGFVYVGDESTPYTNNFIKAQRQIQNKYGEDIETIVMSNINEEDGETYIKKLIDEGCELIFTTSFGYGDAAKKLAASYPDIDFCQATCANTDEDTPNYHTFMGEIYQGRYVAGCVAGMKLRELIDDKKISPDQAVIGYVGAYPYAEVTSGYTAFFLGVRTQAPTATMKVRYTNSWTNYGLEKKYADELIDEGCVIISQHSDTIGPAVACENADADHPVFHVGYNQSMVDVAPTTSLVSTRINWDKYMLAAVDAVYEHKNIEDYVDANIHGYDAGAGFDKGWVEMVELNSIIAAKGTKKLMQKTIDDIISKDIDVFKGDYVGVNPSDSSDTIDLSYGFTENASQSAPTFSYILQDVITIEE